MSIDIELLDACDVTYMVEYRDGNQDRWILEMEFYDRAEALEYLLNAVWDCPVPHRLTFCATGTLCEMKQPEEGKQ